MSSESPAQDFLPDLAAVTPNGATAPVVPAPDPFDIESLRLPQDFSALSGLQPVLTSVAVRKPSKEWWVRVHPDARYHFPTALIALRESSERGETYLVTPNLWPLLQEESTFAAFTLYTAITRQKEVFLWPIRRPGTRPPRRLSPPGYGSNPSGKAAGITRSAVAIRTRPSGPL
jgi:hypothetical protein